MIEYLHKKAAGTTEAPWKVMKEVKWEIPHPKYHLLRSWPGNYVPARHRDNSCQEEIQATVGSTNNNEALCILEAGLNQIKENIWELKTPIDHHECTGNWKFNNYNNLSRVEEQFCRLAAIFGYMNHRSVSRRFKNAARTTSHW